MEQYRVLAMNYSILRQFQLDNVMPDIFEEIDLNVGTSAYWIYEKLLRFISMADTRHTNCPGQYMASLSHIILFTVKV